MAGIINNIEDIIIKDKDNSRLSKGPFKIYFGKRPLGTRNYYEKGSNFVGSAEQCEGSCQDDSMCTAYFFHGNRANGGCYKKTGTITGWRSVLGTSHGDGFTGVK